MTDEQIIKNFRNGVYKNKPMLFGQKFLESVLDLINRQKAEIEQWKEEADRWQNAFCKVNEDMPTIKSEAIKEFAEELEYFVLNEDIEVVKPKCKDYESYINGANQFRHQIKNGINNLIKEMTEVEE